MSKMIESAGPDILIAQLTDLHIGFGQTEPVPAHEMENVRRFRQAVDAVTGFRRKPDLLLLTGDLADPAAEWTYKALQQEIAKIGIPIQMGLGNHDKRAPFQSVFGEQDFIEGKLHSFTDIGPIRIVMIDTLEEGLHGGAFSAQDAAWLDRTLSQKPDRPTLLALHHPPVPTGIGWMTLTPNSDWVDRLATIVMRHAQVRHIIAGHVHCHIQSQFAGRPVTVCRSIAPTVATELDPLDFDRPDNRAMILDESPGYALYHWTGEQFTTFLGTAEKTDTIVRYDDRHAYLPRETMDRQT